MEQNRSVRGPVESDGNSETSKQGAVDWRPETTPEGTLPTSRRAFLATGAAASVASLVGCLGGSSVDEEMPSITFRHRYKRTGIGSGKYDAAIEMGIWEEEGLDVSFKTSSGSQAAAKSVANGKDMFGNGGASAPLGLGDQEQELVIIGQLYEPMGGVQTTGEHGITSWKDLEGKTVGQYPFGSTGPTAKAAMRKKGVDLSKVNFQNIQPGSANKLLLEGEVHATIGWFVNDLAWLRDRGYSPNVLITGHVLNHLGVVLFTRKEVAENKPETVNKFVRGWLKAHQVFANKIDEVFEIYKPKAVEGFDEKIQRESLGNYYAASTPPKAIGKKYGKGWVSPSKMRNTITVFEEAGLLDGSVSAEKAYTNEFIDDNRDLAVETANELYDRLEDYDVGPNYI